MTRALAALLLAGCHASGSATVTIHDDLLAPSESLATCSKGDVAANLAIVSELRDSYHEMIVCGGLALNFNSAIVNVVANAALGRGGPPQLVYQGNGTYATPNGMMMIRTSLTGGSGIGFDVLDPQSYLAGLTITANANGMLDTMARGGSPLSVLGHAAANLEVSFQGQGPGFAVLGLSDGELRSHHLSIDPKRIANAIASHISVANRISVDNDQGGTTVHYILDGAPQPLSQMMSDKAVPMTLASIQATSGIGQSIKVTEWTMQFKGDGGTVLDGTIGLDVDGGAFPYHVTFTYPHRMEPDIALACR